jgi:hypothetical protein
MREGSREVFKAQAAYSSQKKLGDLSTKLPLTLDTIREYGEFGMDCRFVI